MDAINTLSTVSNYPPAKDDGLRTFQASRTDLAAVTRSRQMDVELVTSEGDKVTISLDSRSAGLYTMYEEAQIDDAGAMAYQKSELTMGLYQRQMSFTVEGDLNAAEVRDINKVMKTLDKMMNKFVNDKLKPMAAQARKLNGLDTIAGLDVQISMESRIVTATQSQAAATYDRLGVQTAPQPQPRQGGMPVPAAEADAVADAMAQEVQSTATPAHRMMQFVNQLLDDYRRQMEDLHQSGRQIMDRIHSRLQSGISAETAIEA